VEGVSSDHLQFANNFEKLDLRGRPGVYDASKDLKGRCRDDPTVSSMFKDVAEMNIRLGLLWSGTMKCEVDWKSEVLEASLERVAD
jgi:hypothetical protein